MEIHNPELIYSNDDVGVSLAVLYHQEAQHAIWTLQTVRSGKLEPPRISALCVSFIGLVMAIWSLFNLLGDRGWPVTNWVLLLLSVALMLVSLWLGLFWRTRYWVDISFLKDQKPIRIFCSDQHESDRLQSALSMAMESQRRHPDSIRTGDTPALL